MAGRRPTVAPGLAVLVIRDEKHSDKSNINANHSILLMG